MSEKYCLSLTGAGTYKPEMLQVARAYLEVLSWSEVNRQIIDDNLLQLNSVNNRKRIGSEIIKRLKTLSQDELEFYVESQGDDQSAITWITYCRTYPLMRAFSEQLLAERYKNMRPDVSKLTYQAFIDEEKYVHPELEKITESTLYKIQIRIFGMARDCNLLDKEGTICPLYPSPRFVSLIKNSGNEKDLLALPKVGALL